jgi:hypothetical protein
MQTDPLILFSTEKHREDNAMAKASTGSAITRKAKSGPAELPPRRKAPGKGVAAKGSKLAAATKRLKQPAERRTAPKQAAAKPPVRLSAARKSAPPKAASKRLVTASDSAAKKARIATAAAGRAVPTRLGVGKTAAKTGSRKSSAAVTGARSVASKSAGPRRAPPKAAPSTARRPRPAATSKVAQPPTAPPSTRPPQSFAVSHLDQIDFKADGLRDYAHYRDLGIAVATGGLCQAHVIRFIPPCTDEVRKRHQHAADLQLVYVLQGWIKNEFEGVGEQMMSTGTCWLQPSGIRHTVLDYSADCEVLEIIVPADFKTEEAD